MGIWPIKRVVNVAVVVALGMTLPLAGIALFRFWQVQTLRPAPSELAQASRWLRHGAVCSGAASADMARADLERWDDALELASAHLGLLGNEEISKQIRAARIEVADVLNSNPNRQVPWVGAQCQKISALAEGVLERSVQLGLDPHSRSDRPADMGMRDVTTFLLVWFVVAVALVLWVRRAVVRPGRHLALVLERIADGDMLAAIPDLRGEGMGEVADGVRRALELYQNRDKLRGEKIVELRDLVRRTLEMVQQPVIVVGLDDRIHFVNDAAATLVGAEQELLEGTELSRLPGGDAVRELAQRVVALGATRTETELSQGVQAHVARCAVVRDPVGRPSRVVIVLEEKSVEWWRKLLGQPSG